jgi:hypothetical protein
VTCPATDRESGPAPSRFYSTPIGTDPDPYSPLHSLGAPSPSGYTTTLAAPSAKGAHGKDDHDETLATRARDLVLTSRTLAASGPACPITAATLAPLAVPSSRAVRRRRQDALSEIIRLWRHRQNAYGTPIIRALVRPSICAAEISNPAISGPLLPSKAVIRADMPGGRVRVSTGHVHPAGVTDRAVDDCNLSVSIACAHALN